MVKSSGGRWKGSGSGSAPSSPTRRLKKGGKRGRRLCHMEGCTLCPSFGFEGDVAVSCSHHKEDGAFRSFVRDRRKWFVHSLVPQVDVAQSRRSLS